MVSPGPPPAPAVNCLTEPYSVNRGLRYDLLRLRINSAGRSMHMFMCDPPPPFELRSLDELEPLF